jgi:hypothetical protein
MSLLLRRSKRAPQAGGGKIIQRYMLCTVDENFHIHWHSVEVEVEVADTTM